MGSGVALGGAGIIILEMGLDAVAEAGGTRGLPQVLTVEEVADLMRVDRKTAYAAIAEGGVPGVRRIGRCIRVSRDVLLRWLEQGEAKRTLGR
jgi:excisionase family DNA binding protein